MHPIDAFKAPLLDPSGQVAIVAVLLLVSLDFIIGVTGAVVTKEFSSEKMRAGLLHKFTELACIALGIILDGVLVGGLDLTVQPVLLATCGYIIVMETGSVLELVAKYNPNAQGLVKWLTQFVRPKGETDGLFGE